MTFAEPKNKNYCSVVVALKNFVDLPNCNAVKAALIFGNSVIVGKDEQPGTLGLFFPVETALSPEFLANNNLYRKVEWGNVNPDAKPGFFEEHGRVKAMKFRGHKSEGFWIPIAALSYLDIPIQEFSEGMEFDVIDGFGFDKPQPICHKYIARRNPGHMSTNQPKQARAEDRIVTGQFRFHIDTEQLRRNMHRIEPGTTISISDKWHGTSAIVSNVMVQRKLPWYERVLRKLGVAVQESEYGLVWASRRVVKSVGGEAKVNTAHYYDTDIWGVVAREIGDLVPKGYTVYGEIVGYTPEGSAIQKGYHYGCEAGSHKFIVYRVTLTNPDGQVVELSWHQMQEFCAKRGLEMVKEIYYGQAQFYGEYLNDSGDVELWREDFLNALIRSVEDRLCPYNNSEVPAEGVVVRIERYDTCEVFKLKSFAFLKRESDALDKGEEDIESAQDVPEPVAE
jgi:hypothetical protein